MKMKKYYQILKSRAKSWFSDEFNRQQWAEHVTAVQKSGEYSDIYNSCKESWYGCGVFLT